jgi:hypothetical protein
MHDDNLSAADFLNKEAEMARAAIVQTLQALKEDVKNAADLHYWTREHPWAAVGVASLAGFLAATAVIRAPETEAEARRDRQPREAHENGQPRATAASGLGWLMVPLFDLLKTSVEKYVAGAVQSGSQAFAEADASRSSAPSSEAAEANP